MRRLAGPAARHARRHVGCPDSSGSDSRLDSTGTKRISSMMGVNIPLTWFILGCLAGAELGQLILIPLGSIDVPILWPPTGLLTAALVVTAPPGRRLLPIVSFAVTILSSLVHGHPPALSLLLATVSTGNAWLAALGIRRVIKGAFTMHRVTDILVLIGFAAAVPMVTGAVAAVVPYIT